MSLVVNSVEGDKLFMTLTAVRSGADGLIEKKTNFSFDVSEDHVAEDAQGLVLANQPDFDLDLEAVCGVLFAPLEEEEVVLTLFGR